MGGRREFAAFAVGLGALVGWVLGESLVGGKVLSPADVLFASASFRDVKGPGYEPANRLLMDPVLQFQPWLELSRSQFRRGRLPLWNDLAGCGAPLLANGQSAPFDPFHLIAYLGTLPAALGWMAAARLWAAGLGMFLLARFWGLGAWGRWFAGLCYPFCGFLTVWLLFPSGSVAVWMPWLFLATDRAWGRPGLRSVGVLGLVVGLAFLGGQVQVSAQLLLAAGAYVVWRGVMGRVGGENWTELARRVLAWGSGVGLGVAIAAVAVVPLWVYLGKSPVWSERDRERPSPWRLTRPRALDAVCTAVPYAFGSQRRGQPNLARALGVHNLNESAGGFAGLATLAWLAPQALAARGRVRRVGFLAGLVGFGLLGAFEVAPVANLLRALPVVRVLDNRRLALWVAFGLIVLGGVGLDHLAEASPRRSARVWLALVVVAAGVLGGGALAVGRSGPWLARRAEVHYAKAAAATPGADPAEYRRRADRQVRQALDHLPRTLGLASAELLAMIVLFTLAGRGVVPWPAARGLVLAGTVAELVGFGNGLNPAIDPRDDRPVTAVVARLRAEVGGAGGGRVLGLGEEWPPNVAMRYGLADPRNYDSIELARSLDAFEALYEPTREARSSRREVTWAGVGRARVALRRASVRAVVAATPPPPGLAESVSRVGATYVARLDAEPLVTAGPGATASAAVPAAGEVQVDINSRGNTVIIIRRTYDPGWRAAVDGRRAAVRAGPGPFLSVAAPAGSRRLRLVYDPPEVHAGAAVSASALAITLACMAAGGGRYRPDFSPEGLDGFRRPG